MDEWPYTQSNPILLNDDTSSKLSLLLTPCNITKNPFFKGNSSGVGNNNSQSFDDVNKSPAVILNENIHKSASDVTVFKLISDAEKSGEIAIEPISIEPIAIEPVHASGNFFSTVFSIEGLCIIF